MVSETIVVDLDGTLLRRDMLLETANQLVGRSLVAILQLAGCRAGFTERTTGKAIDTMSLPRTINELTTNPEGTEHQAGAHHRIQSNRIVQWFSAVSDPVARMSEIIFV